MRVLIVSVTTGYGHIAAANALAAEFERNGAEAVIVDMYRYSSQFMYDLMDKGYLFTIKRLPHGFGATYDSMERNERIRKLISVLAGNAVIARKFASYFRDYKPDAIIATHVLSAHILNILKASNFLTVPVLGIATDYCLHPGWEDCGNIDYIVTASELLTPVAAERGIPTSKLLPFGLPVRDAFLTKVRKDEARRRLGLDPKRFTALVMGGSMGYGSLNERVTELLASGPDIRLICICGNNRKLYEKLAALPRPDRLTVLGFVRNVELYMDAADCIVTKPGGLTVSELLAKRLPPVLIDPIPGHELRNMEFLVSNGAALGVPEGSSVVGPLTRLYSDGALRASISASMDRLAKDGAARNLCAFTLGLAHDAISAS